MTLRDLISQVTGNVVLGDYLKNFNQINYNLNIFDIDLQKNLDIDPKIVINNADEQIIIKVEA